MLGSAGRPRLSIHEARIKINNYKKTVALGCLALLFSASLCGKPRDVTVGVFPAAPLVFVEGDRPQGLFIDLLEHIARSHDWRLVYVPGTWSELLLRLQRGELDILPAVGVTPERGPIYDFSKHPVYIDSGVLFTNPRSIPRTVFDLRGKRVAAVRGSVFTKGFEDYIASFGIDCDIVTTDDNPEVMRLISQGRVDAGVCIYSLGVELAREYSVAVTPISFSPLALGFAVTKGRNADLIDGIDESMSAMAGDPKSFYALALDKWTAQRQPYRIPLWLAWLAAALLVCGLCLAAWTFLLRRRVEAETRHLNDEIAERAKAQALLARSLAEKDILLRELYHRTKNTMQVIVSMISLEAARYANDESVSRLVEVTEQRILAIALVQQMLYRSKELSRIAIKDYIQELSTSILRGYGFAEGRVSLDVRIDECEVVFDTAIPLGLILNELMSNSMKYAFPGERKGRISLAYSAESEARHVLRYADDGVGVPEDFDFRAKETLGLKMIFSIGEQQLMGKVSMACRGGVECVVEIPVDQYKERV